MHTVEATSAAKDRAAIVNLVNGRLRWADIQHHLPMPLRAYRIYLVRQSGGVPIPVRAIVRQVLDQYNLTLSEIQSPRRSNYLTAPRHHLCFRLLTETKLSSEQVGRIVNRDNSAVIHGAKVHAARSGSRFDGSFWKVDRVRGSWPQRADAPAVTP